MDRSGETQQRLIAAALHEFKEHGYERATVRGIVARAGVNQAAISYHFKGKRELYLEVLRASLAPPSNGSGLALQELERMQPDEALNALIRMILIPILTSGRSNAIRKLLAWETISPSGLLPDFIAEEIAPYLASARAIIERYLIVSRREEDVRTAAFWLVGQCFFFHHMQHDHVQHDPDLPAGGDISQERAEAIVDLVCELARDGLSFFAASPDSSE